MSSRRLRTFKQWMKSQSIEHSESLDLVETSDSGIAVRALSDLNEGDVVAKIPKTACLTIKTSKGREMIEGAELGGSLGLAVAVMYEKGLGEESMWYGYLQVLPERECVPLNWSLEEVDRLLVGTELHKTVKEDKNLIYDDWKECILPLIESEELKLDPESFSAEQYFAAKSLVTSRSFEIDDYHGSGMVPLADLFNHKTGAENVHFTHVSSHSSSDDDDDDDDDDDVEDGDESGSLDDDGVEDNDDNGSLDDDGVEDSDKLSEQDTSSDENGSTDVLAGTDDLKSDEVDTSSNSRDKPAALEMIIVKSVKAGDEVFNTYGLMGNAALLLRYGFTEPNNIYDIVNIDLDVVLQWSSSVYTDCYSRARLSLWRRFDCSGCISEDAEYFEISSAGEPQLDLLVLLYIMYLPDEVYCDLNQTLPSVGNINKAISILLFDKNKQSIPPETRETDEDYLLTDSVCGALVSIANIRESFYGMNSLDDDKEALSRCSMQERKLYNSLVLRVSERTILEKLRSYASSRSCKRRKITVAKKVEVSVA